MREKHLKATIALADKGVGPFSEIVKASTEVGVVVPSILRKHLADVGCEIVVTERKNGRVKLMVLRPKVDGDQDDPEFRMVAQAIAPDETEALLRATFAAVHEEHDAVHGSQKVAVDNPEHLKAVQELLAKLKSESTK